MKNFKYPSNQKINDYAYGLLENEMSRLTPEAVREGCHKVVAGLDLLLAYYSRYEIFLKSVRVEPEELLRAHNGAKWDSFPEPLQNKMIKSVQAQQKDIYKKLDEMKTFLQMQQKFMVNYTDEQFEKMYALQDEYENV